MLDRQFWRKRKVFGSRTAKDSKNVCIHFLGSELSVLGAATVFGMSMEHYMKLGLICQEPLGLV
jgi:hypothetical protein